MPNKIEIENGNKKGQIKRLIYAYIDFEDYEDAKKYRWYLVFRSGKKYPVAHIPKNNITGGKMTSKLSSLGNFLMNPPKGKNVKYRDNNPFNCRRENLYIPSNPSGKKAIL